MITQNKVLQVLIAKDNDEAQTTAIGSKVREYSALDDGEMALLDEDNKVVGTSEIVLVPKFRAVVRKGTQLVYSDWIEKGKLVSYRGQLYTAATEQVTYVGYNGVTATTAIEALNLNDYILKVIDTSAFRLYGNKRNMISAFYQSDAAATQSEVAADLVKSLIPMLSSPERRIKVERINAGAQANAMASATAAVVYGSKTVTLSEDESLTCPAGSIIRLGTSGAGTAPCYIVDTISVDGLTITLDIPYQGASETIAHTAVETVTEGNWGIKFTGIARANFSPGVFKYDKVRFEIGLEDFGTTPVTYTTAATEGAGNYPQVAEAEWFCIGNGGQIHRIGTPSPTTTLVSLSTEYYSSIALGFYDSAPITVTGQDPKSLKNLIIFFEVDVDGKPHTGGNSSDLNIEALDAWAALAANGAHAASGLAQ